MENKKTFLNIYEIIVYLYGYDIIIEKLANDFKFFLKDDILSSNINLTININFSNPPYDKIPQIPATMYKTDCICYDYNNIRYADYDGKCLVIFDKNKRTADIFSTDENLLYEISYLLLHSQVGELLDLKGFHRIHACAFSYNNINFICMLPQGGGKSTLLMNLLKDNNVKLISDDTPLIDRKGNLYPFPIRVGVCNDFDTTSISNEFITIFNRRKFGQKKLISYEYFKDRIENRKLPTFIISGKRIYSNDPKISYTNKICIFKELFKNCVIGYGLPQVIEYFLIGGFKDTFNKTIIVFSRFYACIRLLFKTVLTYCFYLSKDKEKNSYYFFNFFHK